MPTSSSPPRAEPPENPMARPDRTAVTDRDPLTQITAGSPAAPTLVLLHGITSCAAAQAEAITRWVNHDYRVVALDARGHGLSPRWSPAQLAQAGQVLVDDVAATLRELAEAARGREVLGLPVDRDGSGHLRPPVLLGHSMGAATAMVLAGRHPELVSGVVLEDPALYGTRDEAELLARGAARERARAAQAVEPTHAVAQAMGDARPELEVLPSVWASQCCDPALLRTGVVAPQVPWEEALAALRVPTLLLSGNQPASARVGEGGLARARELNPRIETVLIDGAGHRVRGTRPEGYYAAVEAWLERLLGR
ncbi:alpha/beta fold hydrolase [Actinomyces trachealis]|uniref:alpha/beta fold hydrolase n=1 Tax=Actinomyces trachealis TaxID=2763540 RepID=UPI001FD538B8|nr:alpha/beta hydrolase [Actinomyces trachealis]